MDAMQIIKPDKSKFSSLPGVKQDVFRFVSIPHKKFFYVTLSESNQKVMDATDILQKYINDKKAGNSIKAPLLKLAKAIDKLSAAIKQGDNSDTTLLILGAAYALKGHLPEAQKVSLALRERGAHYFENIVAAMICYGFSHVSKYNDQMSRNDTNSLFNLGKDNEANAKALANGSPAPYVVLQILEFKKNNGA
jgi:hypothetical protein